ncbi:MAG: Rab family GTPase [Candidatus Thorarchaeota archaeon]
MTVAPVPHMFKLVALGDGGVGKTSCIKRYTEDSFSEHYMSTIGTTFALKTIDVERKDKWIRARVVIWDLAGQPSYNELRRRYMAGASMGFIAYDVTRPKTFMNLFDWFTRFKTVCPDAVVALVANKVDVDDRQVPSSAGVMLADWLNVTHFDVSAKTGENIPELFTELITRTVKTESSESG